MESGRGGPQPMAFARVWAHDQSGVHADTRLRWPPNPDMTRFWRRRQLHAMSIGDTQRCALYSWITHFSLVNLTVRNAAVKWKGGRPHPSLATRSLMDQICYHAVHAGSVAVSLSPLRLM